MAKFFHVTRHDGSTVGILIPLKDSVNHNTKSVLHK